MGMISVPQEPPSGAGRGRVAAGPMRGQEQAGCRRYPQSRQDIARGNVSTAVPSAYAATAGNGLVPPRRRTRQ